eukprot:349759-Chlamydomonas_euryale.AAC.8
MVVRMDARCSAVVAFPRFVLPVATTTADCACAHVRGGVSVCARRCTYEGGEKMRFLIVVGRRVFLLVPQYIPPAAHTPEYTWQYL